MCGAPGEPGGLATQGSVFADHDILVTPGLAQSPIAASSGRGRWLASVLANARYAPFAAPWNLAGWPAMVVPAGVHLNGRLCRCSSSTTGDRSTALAVAAQLSCCRRGHASRRRTPDW
jgi:amidase